MTAVVTDGNATVTVECSPPLHTSASPGLCLGQAGLPAAAAQIEGQVRGLQKMINSDTWCP